MTEQTPDPKAAAPKEPVEPAPGSIDKAPPSSPEPPRAPGPPRGSSWLPEVTTTLAAIGLAVVVGAVLIAFSDQESVDSLTYIFSYPWDFFANAGDAIWSSYSALVRGSLGGFDNIGTTLVRSAPLICAGLGVTVAFRAGLFNIGAQGQLVVGSLCAAYVAFHFDLPRLVHVPFALIAGLIGGAVWGFLPGILKARTGAHEVITTIMLNYLAVDLVLNFTLSREAFQRPGSDESLTPAPAASSQFWSVGNLHLGVVVAFLAAGLVWWVIERSKFGFEMRAVGANGDAARTAGMSVPKVYTTVMVMAGALAGLAATMDLLGKGTPVSDSTAGSIGFDAITVALLGRATPLGTVLAGLLFGALSVGGGQMQISAGTPKELANVLQALIVLFVAAPTLVRGLIRMRTGEGSATVMAKGWGS